MTSTTFDLNKKRLSPPDLLRGLIIVLMALDHANHFVAQKHSPGEYWGGPLPTYQDALTFLTRFITHLAAPGFFFLMGIGMVLFALSRQNQGWSKVKIVQYFWIRGFLLITIQFLLINRAWELSPQGWSLNIYIGVLFALGGAMILGSFALWLPTSVLILLTLTLFIGSEFLVPEISTWNQVELKQPLDYLNLMIIQPGGTTEFWSNYPILPWVEFVTFGLLFGNWLSFEDQKAYRRALVLGIIFLFSFGLLRALNDVGNIRPRAGTSWIDFLNVIKYPPSMSFTLLTTGFNLILLWIFSQVKNSSSKYLQPLTVFGQEPLFFYISHLFVYAGLGLILTPSGTHILLMYPIWIFGLIILYPLCLWYGEIKRKPITGKFLQFF